MRTRQNASKSNTGSTSRQEERFLPWSLLTGSKECAGFSNKKTTLNFSRSCHHQFQLGRNRNIQQHHRRKLLCCTEKHWRCTCQSLQTNQAGNSFEPFKKLQMESSKQLSTKFTSSNSHRLFHFVQQASLNQPLTPSVTYKSLSVP